MGPELHAYLRQPLRLALAYRLAVMFTLLVALLAAVAMTYVGFSWRAVKQERVEHLHNLAELGAASAELFLQRYSERSAMLAEDIRMHGGLDAPEVAQRQLMRYAAADVNLAGIYLFDAAGNLVAGTSVKVPGRNAADPSANRGKPAHMEDAVFRRDHETALASAKPIIGRVRYGARVQDWILPFRARVTDAQGNPVYVLSLVVPLARQRAMWDAVSLPRQWAIGLLRDDGYLQGRHPTPTDPASVYLGAPGGALIGALNAERFPTRGLVEGSEARSGTTRDLITFKRLESFPITAYVAMPEREVWAEWRRHMQVPAMLFAISLAGLVSAGVWAVRQQRVREAERDLAEQSLRASAAALKRQTLLLEQSQQAAQIGAWELNMESGELYWTAQTYRLHDLSPERYTPDWDKALGFFAPDSQDAIREAIARGRARGEPWDLELQLTTANGRRLWVRSTGAVEMVNGRPAKAWGAFQDITQRRESEAQIARMAHYDELTGLANRNLFNMHLAHAIMRAQRNHGSLAVLFIDLDRFKNINDALGHDVGDEVLQRVAARLSHALRASDILARLGGDEFVVIAEDVTDTETIGSLGQKLLCAVDQPIQVRAQDFVLTASIGVSMYPNDGTDAQTLLKNADTAMYRAKEQGRNNLQFYSAYMGSANVDRLSMETQLKKAVAEGNQFVLHYQPRVSLVDGRMTGVECLVRWMNPERGMVQPAQFIPLAEELGLIREIGGWVMRTAVRQAAAWQREGLPPLRVSVNISAQQLYGSSFLDELRANLADSGLDPESLELELTESVMMQRTQQVADLLYAIRALGVQLSIDDFGTGYSSLAYLKRLPIHSLKIDRSFVHDVPGDGDDVTIVHAMIALAHSLRMQVVAEGVENSAQLEFLRSEGCDEIQGFLASPPVTAEVLAGMLRSGLDRTVQALTLV
jgi:diguanylate cyclase (GGDEF)-like protein